MQWSVVMQPHGHGIACYITISDPGQLLGRGDKIQDFVRRGHSEMWTEMTLQSRDPTRPLVVYRKVKIAQDGQASNEWKLNGMVFASCPTVICPQCCLVDIVVGKMVHL